MKKKIYSFQVGGYPNGFLHVFMSIYALSIVLLSGWLLLSMDLTTGVRAGGILITVLLAVKWPAMALTGLLLILPILGGNKPAMPQTVLYYHIFSAVVCGVAMRWLFDLLRKPLSNALSLKHPLILVVSLYVLVALLSLTSLPLPIVAQLVSPQEYFAVSQIVRSDEGSLLYPFLNVMYQLQLLLIFWVLIYYADLWKNWLKLFGLAILIGLGFSVVAGLLDYYNFIDLRVLRPLDHLVNPGDVQFRLQSFFGHSGWYAQYLTLAIPSILILLTFNINRKAIIALIIILLVLVEYVLILTFQRGGWISYPFTVLVIWFSIYVLTRNIDGAKFFETLKKSAMKIFISVPLTVVISIGFIAILNQGESTSKYIQRAEAITNTSDRTRYIPVSINLASVYPLLGGGSESFAYRFREEYLEPDGLFNQEPNTIGTYYGSAHNVYLQTLTGKGYIGLLTLLFILGMLVMYAGAYFRRGFTLPNSEQAMTTEQKIVLMMGLSFAAAFAIYGNVQEIFYVPGLNTLMFFILGILAATVPPPFKFSKRFIIFIFGILTCFTIAHLYMAYIQPGYTTQKINKFNSTNELNRNCYAIESLGEKTWRWCKKNARIQFAISEETDSVELILQAGNPDLIEKPLLVTYGALPDGIKHAILTHQTAMQQVRIPLTDESVISEIDKAGAVSRSVVIAIDVSHTWVPYLMDVSADTRELGVSVSIVK